MLLEIRLDRRLDLLDLPHHRLDFRARGEVEEGDAGAGAGGIAAGGDLAEVAVGNQAERHRIERVDVAAERADQSDASRRAGAAALDQQFRAGVERGLGELDRAHVGLIDQEPRLALAQDIGERATDRFDAASTSRPARRR